MVLEVAILDIKPGQAQAFERAFEQAQFIISDMQGYQSHQLQRCLEHPDRYLLLVTWDTLEDHTVGFRGSPAYQHWRSLLHHFYDPFPTVEHFKPVAGCQHPDGLMDFASASAAGQLTEQVVACPYCGEAIAVLIDPEDAGDQYIEDCQVCCRPITFHVGTDATGDLSVTAHDENETY